MTTPVRSEGNTFHPGERVVVASGVYQGTIGHFIGLRPDANWAEILEESRNVVRTHPVVWLRHCPDGDLVWSELLTGPN